MTLDPETIAMIIALLWPKIQECLEKGKTQGQIVKLLRNPTRGQRSLVLQLLPKINRGTLNQYWRVKRNRRVSRRLATTIVRNVRKAA